MKNLANKLVKKLIQNKLKISFAESCTGGMLSSSITSVSGSSKVFNLGLVTYSNKVKMDILKVPKKIITQYGAVSKECCLSMVKNLSKISKSGRSNKLCNSNESGAASKSSKSADYSECNGSGKISKSRESHGSGESGEPRQFWKFGTSRKFG